MSVIKPGGLTADARDQKHASNFRMGPTLGAFVAGVLTATIAMGAVVVPAWKDLAYGWEEIAHGYKALNTLCVASTAHRLDEPAAARGTESGR
jgi:hypothetical protein